MIRPPPRSTLFPYPPLSRSVIDRGRHAGRRRLVDGELLAAAGLAGVVAVAAVDRLGTRPNPSHGRAPDAVYYLATVGADRAGARRRAARRAVVARIEGVADRAG